MSNVYDLNAYADRVKFAAAYISAGRNTTRAFDTCFEMYDGSAVAVALARRARARPDTKLAANLWRYLDRGSVEQSEARFANVPTADLPLLAEGLRWIALDCREKRMAENAA